VNSERLDILSDGQLRKILDSKLEKYAKATFRKRFWYAPRLFLILCAVANP